MNPADRDKKISGVHKWEQAFRVYAAIYSQANPLRSAEIWQYVYIINKAASVFSWHNVSEYDFVFRQMMGTNPECSWAKTYSQMWNICMLDSQRGNLNSHGYNVVNQNSNASLQKKKSGGNGGMLKIKPDYCWKFNKNGECKWSTNCKFINWCSYCDEVSHGLYQCPKRNTSVASGGSTVVNSVQSSSAAN